MFDAFAALLGLADGRITYDAQAAIRLEAAAQQSRASNLPKIDFEVVEFEGLPAIDWGPCFRLAERIGDLRERPADFALAFHHALTEGAVRLVELALERELHKVIALSGGVFMNAIISDLMVRRFREIGLQPLLHRKVPPNDGGISFGQAVIAGNQNSVIPL